MERIHDSLLKCVCFLGCRVDGKPIIGGTAFLVDSDGKSAHVVTALHNIGLIRRDYPHHPVILFVNTPQGPREVETDPEDWIGHPDTSQVVDAAVYRIPLAMDGLDHSKLHVDDEHWVTDGFMTKFDVGIGDELYFPGLFVRHRGASQYQPILRVGTLASIPQDLVNTELGKTEVYLAEVRSIGGFSGSPVFLRMPMWRAPVRLTDETIVEISSNLSQGLGMRDMFLGVVHGHYDVDAILSGKPIDLEEVNMGIGLITPAQRIRELLEHPELGASRSSPKSAR